MAFGPNSWVDVESGDIYITNDDGTSGSVFRIPGSAK